MSLIDAMDLRTGEPLPEPTDEVTLTHRTEGARVVRGYRFGIWAATPLMVDEGEDAGRWWHVTHAPTGGGVRGVMSVDAAFEVARRLSATLPDFLTDRTVGDVAGYEAGAFPRAAVETVDRTIVDVLALERRGWGRSAA